MTALRRFVLFVAIFLPALACAGPPYSVVTDAVVMSPRASVSCPAGRACLYSLSGDNQIYGTDGSGLQLKMWSAKSYRSSTSCAGLASPAAGDVCYDTTLGVFRHFGVSWTTAPTDDTLLMHLAGTEIVTGAKTFPAAGATAATLPAIKGGNLNTSGHTVPNVADDTFALLGAAQTLSNKTLASPALSGTATGTYTLGGTPTITAPTLSGTVSGTYTLGGTPTITAPALSGTVTGTYTLGGTPTIGAATLSGALAGGGNKITGLAQGTASGEALHAGRQVLAGTGLSGGGALTSDVTLSLSTPVAVANGGTGAGSAAAHLVFASPAGSSGAPSFRTLVVADHSPGSEIETRTTGGATTAIAGGATGYLVAPGMAASATDVALTVTTENTEILWLQCLVTTAPGAAQSETFTVRQYSSGAWSDTTATCTISGTSTSCGASPGLSIGAQGVGLGIKAVQSAGSVAAGISCSFEETN